MNEEKLKPCPFCGGFAEIIQYSDDRWRVACRGCYSKTDSFLEKEEAVNVWNTRRYTPLDEATLKAASRIADAVEIVSLKIKKATSAEDMRNYCASAKELTKSMTNITRGDKLFKVKSFLENILSDLNRAS